MTPSELKYQYEQKQAGHFFDRKTMKFFNDTMKNFGCRDAGSHWELYRKRPVKHGIKSSHYFDKTTFTESSHIPESATSSQPKNIGKWPDSFSPSVMNPTKYYIPPQPCYYWKSGDYNHE